MSQLVIAPVEARSVSRRQRLQVSWLMVACFFIVGIVAVMAVLGAAIPPYGPSTQNLTDVLARPSAAHWLGTDSLGRDVFSRLIAGARTACVGPVLIAYVPGASRGVRSHRTGPGQPARPLYGKTYRIIASLGARLAGTERNTVRM